METELSPVIAHLRSFQQNKHRRPQSAGRKQPKLTKALAERFCDIIAETDQSLFDIVAADPSLPHHKTLFNWQQRVPWFAKMWQDARIRQTHFLVQKCLALANSAQPKTAHVVRVQFDIYRFIAAKFNPDFYGDKPAFAPSSTTVNVGISIDPQRLADLRTKLDASRSAFIPKMLKNHQSNGESASPEHNQKVCSRSSKSPKRDTPEARITGTPNKDSTP